MLTIIDLHDLRGFNVWRGRYGFHCDPLVWVIGFEILPALDGSETTYSVLCFTVSVATKHAVR